MITDPLPATDAPRIELPPRGKTKAERNAYRKAYFQLNKQKEYATRRANKEIQIAYLKKNGLWPIIPEERRYEIPPNLRELALAKQVKRYGRQPRDRSNDSEGEAQEVLHE